jgi:hypothetical protein
VTLTLLPSSAVVIISWLNRITELTAITYDRIGTKLDSVLPAVRVQRVGGSSREPWRDAPVVQIECWAPDERTADLMSRIVVAALPTLRGTYGTGKVWAYEIDSGPFWSADDVNLSTNVRYIMSIRLLTTP